MNDTPGVSAGHDILMDSVLPISTAVVDALQAQTGSAFDLSAFGAVMVNMLLMAPLQTPTLSHSTRWMCEGNMCCCVHLHLRGIVQSAITLTAKLLILLNTTACILVPRRGGGSWRPLLYGMMRVTEYPKGFKLFDSADKGLTEPFVAYHDAASPQLKASECRRNADSDCISADGKMIMQFDAELSHMPAQALFDSAAQGVFLSRSWMERAGVSRKLKPASRAFLTVANGDPAPILGEISLF